MPLVGARQICLSEVARSSIEVPSHSGVVGSAPVEKPVRELHCAEVPGGRTMGSWTG